MRVCVCVCALPVMYVCNVVRLSVLCVCVCVRVCFLCCLPQIKDFLRDGTVQALNPVPANRIGQAVGTSKDREEAMQFM